MITAKKNLLNKDENYLFGIFTVIIKLVVLCCLVLWMFWPEVASIISGTTSSSERVHSLIVPFAILLLIFLRRKALTKKLVQGSAWGLLFIIGGLVLYTIATWPFSYGYVHDLAMIPVLAGVVLVACGWRVLKLSLPILLLVMLSIPIGVRIYARLIIQPETYTIGLTAAIIDMLPEVDTVVNGVDLTFKSSRGSGVIALGESNRAARLLLTFAVVGVFVVFSERRTLRRIIMIGFAAIPIILFCNFFRFLCWSILAVYSRFDPLSPFPRMCSAICALLMVYFLFTFISCARLNFFEDVDENIGVVNTSGVANG